MADNIYIYHTSPNQKSIVTHKTTSDEEHIYSKYNVDATLSAAKELSDRAFKLYARMNLHQDGHIYALSPVAIHADIGMSDKRYREAVKELTDKGYLVQQEKHKSLYVFYEFPQRDDEYYRQEPKSPDNPPESTGSSSQNKRIAQPNQNDTPAILGGEIEHNITSHTTNNITVNSNNMGYSPTEERSFVINEIFDECSTFLSNPPIENDFSSGSPIYGYDNATMYEGSEDYDEEMVWDDDYDTTMYDGSGIHVTLETDLNDIDDDELPF